MRILIVGFSNSSHVRRWIDQIADLGWDIHLVPSVDLGMVDTQMRNVTVHHGVYHTKHSVHVRYRGLYVHLPSLTLSVIVEQSIRRLQEWVSRNYWADHLRHVIEEVKPDIVHTMEFQHGGYLTLQVKHAMGDKFPPWIISNYGSDLYLFGRIKAHQERLADLLASCDFYTAECERDYALAKNYGLRGMALPAIPNGGGIDLEKSAQFRQPGPVSQRRVILVKGYQHFAGRSLVALNALEYCSNLLPDYEVVVHSPTGVDVSIQAELVSQRLGIPIKCLRQTSHDELLRYHGHARTHIGLSISDAASTSMLEAMTMGGFPIQSNTACTDEWFTEGEGGFSTPPENAAAVGEILRRVLTDDNLVDRAAEINVKVIADKLAYQKIQKNAIQIYESAMTQGKRLKLKAQET